MRRNQALSIVEIVIVLAIIVAGVAILLPAMGGRTHCTRQMQNSTQVRGIHSGLVLFAQGNNMHYPGVKADGETLDSAVGLTTQGRVQKLIEDNYFTLEYARSPSEVQTGTTSYAMLKIDVKPDGMTILKSTRNSEWNDTMNNESIVISDRALDNGGSYTHIKSIHTNPAAGTTDWRGSVGWNDNHVTFESTNILTTTYGKSRIMGSPNNTADNLFASDAPPDNGDDAFMVWHGTDGL